MVSGINAGTRPAGDHQQSRIGYMGTELGGGGLTWCKTRLFQRTADQAVEAPSSYF